MRYDCNCPRCRGEPPPDDEPVCKKCGDAEPPCEECPTCDLCGELTRNHTNHRPCQEP
jgi:hypothetical protein